MIIKNIFKKKNEGRGRQGEVEGWIKIEKGGGGCF